MEVSRKVKLTQKKDETAQGRWDDVFLCSERKLKKRAKFKSNCMVDRDCLSRCK